MDIDGKTIHFAFSGGRPPRIPAGRDATPDGSEIGRGRETKPKVITATKTATIRSKSETVDRKSRSSAGHDDDPDGDDDDGKKSKKDKKQKKEKKGQM